MNPDDPQPDLRSLHAAFVSLTGQTILWNMARECEWQRWVNWRRERPFNEADLATVIAYLKAQVKAGKREGIKFGWVIGHPDDFEETLEMLRSLERKPKVEPGKARVLEASGRPAEPVRKTGFVRVGDLVAAMRKAVDGGSPQ